MDQPVVSHTVVVVALEGAQGYLCRRQQKDQGTENQQGEQTDDEAHCVFLCYHPAIFEACLVPGSCQAIPHVATLYIRRGDFCH